ncbi:hypothetical protein [Qipengyuania sp. DGS5-3]|uniref:hypothetical protein n=1 Tax=Qipengyuania sp. DGS5-3 TaxID=3349632 RepID=UPI0036D363D7
MLTLSGGPAWAGQKAEKIKIEAGSKKAAVIIRAPQLKPAPGKQTAYRIELQQYHPEEQRVGGPGITLKAKPKLFYGDDYLVADIEPGIYAFREVSVQDFWAVCFHESSRTFEVKPGQIVFLGNFNAARHVWDVQIKANDSLRTISVNNQLVHFFDNIEPPAISAITEEQMNKAVNFANENMPRSTVEPTAANYSEARFGTGSDIFGMTRSCGGWHQGKAKPKKGKD